MFAKGAKMGSSKKSMMCVSRSTRRLMIDETRKLDRVHETRTHGSQPRPWDEICAQYADSWGMSMASNNLLTSNNPLCSMLF